MSATIGAFTFLTINLSAFVDSSSGHETLTMSAPASSSDLICLIVSVCKSISH